MRRFTTAAVAFALVLAACGGATEATPSSPAAAPATAAAPTTITSPPTTAAPATTTAPTTAATTAPTTTAAPTTTIAPTTTTVVDALPVAVTRDVAYSGTQLLDVWAPTSASPWPVLVLLHGFPGNTRSGYDALAERIAGGGVVVYNVDWPVERFMEDAEIVACAVGFARSTAPEYGGSSDRVTLMGHSAGASIGATVALAAELLEPVEGCAATGASVVPDALVGVAGDYDYAISGVAAHLKETDPAVWEVIDPYTNIGRNAGLDVHLLHGNIDDVNPVESAMGFYEALHDAGYDATLDVLEGVGHNSPVAPTFDAFHDTVALALEAVGA